MSHVTYTAIYWRYFDLQSPLQVRIHVTQYGSYQLKAREE